MESYLILQGAHNAYLGFLENWTHTYSVLLQQKKHIYTERKCPRIEDEKVCGNNVVSGLSDLSSPDTLWEQSSMRLTLYKTNLNFH